MINLLSMITSPLEKTKQKKIENILQFIKITQNEFNINKVIGATGEINKNFKITFISPCPIIQDPRGLGPARGPARGPALGPARGPNKGPDTGSPRGQTRGPAWGPTRGPLVEKTIVAN